MTAQQNISFLLEIILNDETHQVSLRVNTRRSDSNKPTPVTSKTLIDLLHQRGFGKYYIFDERSINFIIS